MFPRKFECEWPYLELYTRILWETAWEAIATSSKSDANRMVKSESDIQKLYELEF